jgi:hypothetical protein
MIGRKTSTQRLLLPPIFPPVTITDYAAGGQEWWLAFTTVTVTVYAFYAFYAWWIHFPQSGALAEGTSLPTSRNVTTVIGYLF